MRHPTADLHPHGRVQGLAVLALLLTVLTSQPSTAQVSARGDKLAYLPLIQTVPSAAGRYSCTDTDAGVVTHVSEITLNPDGTSIYHYLEGPYAPQTVYGTWEACDLGCMITLTGFHWSSLYYTSPGVLWNAVPHPNPVMRIECLLQQ